MPRSSGSGASHQRCDALDRLRALAYGPPMPEYRPEMAVQPTADEALAGWQALVRADAEQVPRVNERPPEPDFYASAAPSFRPGPGAMPSTELPVLLELALPGDRWLDIGAGGGRFAVPLAQCVASVIALEPSPAMREQLARSVAEAGVTNVTVDPRAWPIAGWDTPVDVTLAAHVLYDERGIVPFIEAMEAHSRRLCIAIMGNASRGAHLAELFEAVHGEPYAALPSLREFVALLGALGRRYDVRTVDGGADREQPLADAIPAVRRWLWLAEGSDRDQRMQALLVERYGTTPGMVRMPPMRRHIGIVSWTPPTP